MKNAKRIVIIAAGLAVLSACSSRSPLDTTSVDRDLYKEHMPQCTFADGFTEAPDWVCGFPMKEYPISDIGYSKSGLEEEAKADAMAKLAARVRTTVETEMIRTNKTYGSGYTSDFESVSKQRVREALVNTRVLFRLKDPTTFGLHVLVVADVALYEESIRRARVPQDTGNITTGKLVD